MTFEGEETDGAVSTPVVEIDPAVVYHSTDVLLVPLTVAENCWVAADASEALRGFTDTVIPVLTGGFTVTVAEAFTVVAAALVAVTVTYEVALTVGAVRTPLLEIEPAEVDQMTAVLLDPPTIAENCCEPPDASVELVGDICTVTCPTAATEM